MGKLKLGFNINAFAGEQFKPFPFKPLEIISRIGYRWVELRCDKPYWWFPDTKPERIEELKAFLKKLHLQVASVCASTASGFFRSSDDFSPPGQRFGPSFADREEKNRKLRVDFTKKVIDYAAALGCPNVNTSTGYIPQGSKFKECWERVRDCYAEIATYASKHGIWVNIEYEPGKRGPGGLFLGNAEDTLKMIEEVGLSNLGVTLDVGHSIVCGENTSKVIRDLAAKGVLRHVHLEDIKDKVHFHEIPGDGDINFLPIFQALKEVNYEGCVSVELYSLWNRDPVSAAERAYRYLIAKFGDFFG